MTPERWQKITQLFDEALEIEPQRRAAFLAEACAEDGELRCEVESLLAARDRAGDFLRQPAIEVEAAHIAADRTANLTGQNIAHFETLSLIGAGAMGEVYLARDTLLDRKVALKLLPARFTQDASRLRRFAREARAASSLNHRNIITVYEIGKDGDRHFIAAEFVEGATMRERMAGGPLELGEAIGIATQIATALEAAHASGIVHRDIKPENLILRPDGLVKVLDFGIAKLTEKSSDSAGGSSARSSNHSTEQGTVIGTPGYMSPEQARGLEVDARADIFSLGVVLYEMIVGYAPFSGVTSAHVIVALLDKEPEPISKHSPGAPIELDEIIAKALAKDPGRRFQSAREMLADLQAFELKRSLSSSSRSSFLRRASAAENNRIQGEAAPINAPSSASLFDRRWLMRPAILTAIVMLFGLVAGYYWRQSGSHNPIRSIAVLPFSLLNSEADEYLSVGLADILITRLSNLKRIAVRPTRTVLKYKDRQPDPVAIGREQKVDAVLEGSIHRLGEKIRVTARLVSVRDGSSLWAGKFDGMASDLFAAEDAIAQQLAGALALNLNAAEKQLLVKRGTDNVEAQQLYLKGRFFWNKRNKEGTVKGLEFFEQAIKLDPNYALAYVGVADSYALDFLELALTERKARAKAAAIKALEIDETLAEAHLSLAFVKHQIEWDWSGAEKEYKRAIELDPNYAQAHHWYAVYLAYLKEAGWFEKALAEYKRALELDPTSLIINTNLGFLYTFAGMHDQAIDQLRKTVEMDPSFSRARLRLGQTYSFKGMHEQAIAELKEALRLSGDEPDVEAVLGCAYARAGKRDEAMEILRELNEMCERNTRCLYDARAIIHAYLGEKALAFELLQQGIENRYPGMNDIKVSSYYNELRSDPRFADLLWRMGLAP